MMKHLFFHLVVLELLGYITWMWIFFFYSIYCSSTSSLGLEWINFKVAFLGFFRLWRRLQIVETVQPPLPFQTFPLISLHMSTICCPSKINWSQPLASHLQCFRYWHQMSQTTSYSPQAWSFLNLQSATPYYLLQPQWIKFTRESPIIPHTGKPL